MIQLVADRVTNSEALRDMVETADARLGFGSLRRSDFDKPITDVLLYYTFPAGTLDDDALLTLLHIVLSSVRTSARRWVRDLPFAARGPHC